MPFKKKILSPIFFALILSLLFQGSLFAKEAIQKETQTLEIKIFAPAEFIYPYLIYEEKISKWNRDKSIAVSFPKGIEPRVGKQIRVELKNIPTKPWILMEIIKLDENVSVLTRFIDGVLTGRFEYRLERISETETLFIHEIQVKPVGPVVTIIWEFFGKRVHLRKMGKFMKNIKTVVEKDLKKQ